jgi:hypothetical protein
MGLLPPNLLSDLERCQALANKFLVVVEQLQRSNDGRLKRLVNVEADIKHLQTTTRYLQVKKWGVDLTLATEIQTMK